ncbi:MAG: threonine synthase [Balneolaceae bacterium]
MIKLISTGGDTTTVSFPEAMWQGQAPDGGLYVPQSIPALPESWWSGVADRTFHEIGAGIATPWLAPHLNEQEVRTLVEEALPFDAPLVDVEGTTSVLELFHGPTLAFKDFGAQFMAKLFGRLGAEDDRELLILVATSGDTGSAVASGFHGVPGTRVCLLYPSGRVSPLQEKQMTTLGGNVTALEVDGAFDDCQRLVKEAFRDRELNETFRLSSANSINIARLLPQSFYYVRAVAQLQERGERAEPVFVVPSGNFGNLTAGLLANRMGMPAHRFVAATNRNDVFPNYLETGRFNPKPSVQTLSNAMDVGNPSNFERIMYLFGGSLERVREQILAIGFDDHQTTEEIRRAHEEYGYLADPHTAVGLLAARSIREQSLADPSRPLVVLSTAHPAKFRETVEAATGAEVEIPERLAQCLSKEKQTIAAGSRYSDFRNLLNELF